MSEKALTVFIQVDDGRDMVDFVEIRKDLIAELSLNELNILRGNAAFCLEMLGHSRSHPAIVVIKPVNVAHQDEFFQAGASKVYSCGNITNEGLKFVVQDFFNVVPA